MMLENNVSLVIMLCPESENDKEMCIKYFEPKESDQPSVEFGDITLTLKSKQEPFEGLVVRKLEISRNGCEPKVVTHI
jgi:protein tyrosine phosphatase